MPPYTTDGQDALRAFLMLLLASPGQADAVTEECQVLKSLRPMVSS